MKRSGGNFSKAKFIREVTSLRLVREENYLTTFITGLPDTQ